VTDISNGSRPAAKRETPPALPFGVRVVRAVGRIIVDLCYLLSPQRRRRQKILKKFGKKR